MNEKFGFYTKGKKNLQGTAQFKTDLVLEGDVAKAAKAEIDKFWADNKPKGLKKAKSLSYYAHTVADLDEAKSQIAHGETERETANMLSFLTEVVGIRDDMYLGAGDTYQRNFARAVQEGFDEGILHQRPSIINLQSDSFP